MGIFNGISVMNKLAKLRDGKTVKMSIADVVSTLINLPAAERNLSKKQFNEVFALYKKLSKAKGKYELNIDSFLGLKSHLILKFDAVAPFEKYSGEPEEVTLMYLEGLRCIGADSAQMTGVEQQATPNAAKSAPITRNSQELNFAKELFANSNGVYSEADAELITVMLFEVNDKGKKNLPKMLDETVRNFVFVYGKYVATVKVLHTIDVLVKHNVLCREEAVEIAEYYCNYIDKQK